MSCRWINPSRALGHGANVMPFRILHVDDDPDIREIVELSLTLDPMFTVLSCADASEALGTAAAWGPDLMLCDVMMPVMDGPALVARLRKSSGTANIPVVFMTARAQPREIDHFMSLGAVGVIVKPFDPMTLAETVRGYLRRAKLATVRDQFSQRLRADAITLGHIRDALRSASLSPVMMDELQSCAHKLAGAAGIFGLQAVSSAASKLEDFMIDRGRGGEMPGRLEVELDMLVACIERE
jgi:CheY-like chemotaxis protein